MALDDNFMVTGNSKSWYTYIVQCSDGTLYTGIARNIEERLLAHNSGSGAKYTRTRLPVILVYHEEHPSRSLASRREYQLKKMTRTQKQKLIHENET